VGSDAVAAYFRRPLGVSAARGFEEYLSAKPAWPGWEERDPREASMDRVVIIDFGACPHDPDLDLATGYGVGLPGRYSAQVASGTRAVAHVLCVLPEGIRSLVASDAAALLVALRAQTGYRQYIVRLEKVVGDTCLRWHSDRNISRSLITYVGPGTLCAHEAGVARASSDSSVTAVDEASAAVQMGAGDVLMMKGGLWQGVEGRGAAHRAPIVGPVPTCQTHRLLLKVDISEDF